MTWRDAEVRLAAKNATVIRAALRQSIDAAEVWEAYKRTQPQKSDNPTLDRAKARAWAMLNVKPDNDALERVYRKLWSEGYVFGDAVSNTLMQQARLARRKAEEPTVPPPTLVTDWAAWTPGDAAVAALVRPPSGLMKLLDEASVTIRGIDRTTFDLLGTALADSVAAGLTDKGAAKLIQQHIASPARALRIAVTEQNRAMSEASKQRYKDAGLQQMEWDVSDPCTTCAQNANAVVNIGDTFPSGHTQPPAHPFCRCSLLPVIDYGDEDPTAGSVTQVPAPPVTPALDNYQPMPYTRNEPDYDAFDPDRASTFEDYYSTYPEMAETMPKNLVPAFEKAAEGEVRIALTPQTLEKVVADGRMKTAFEAASSRTENTRKTAKWYLDTRLKFETNVVGIPDDIPNAARPVYGTVHRGSRFWLFDYGDVDVVLKDAVKGRTSMTMGDSLDGLIPVNVTDVIQRKTDITDYWRASGREMAENGFGFEQYYGQPVTFAERMNLPEYFEAQIHGGVTLADIAAVEMKQDAFLALPQATKEGLEKAGIQIVIKN